jgi:hypothetical protein
MKSRIFKGILFVLVLALSLIPYDTEYVPEWRLRVVDGNGLPCKRQLVSQYCTNYTLGIHPCETEDNFARLTDEEGYVVFPARRIRASFLYRVTRPVLGLLLLIANGEYGKNGSIGTTGPCGTAGIEYQPGGPLPDTIMVGSSESGDAK